MLLFLIAALGLAACGGGRPDKPRVVLLGLDGADWTLIDPLIAQGRLPLFQELKQTGAWGSLRTITPAKSPVVWASIATGKKPEKHGVLDFRSTRRNRKGKFPLASSLDLREPAIWEMLDSQGLRSVVVNWYLSFPPRPFGGLNVSDYFADSVAGGTRDRAARLRQSVFPPGRAEELARGLDLPYRRVLERTGLPDYPALAANVQDAASLEGLPVLPKVPDMVRKEHVVAEVAARLFREEEFDLFAAYFRLPDEIQHIAYIALIDEAERRRLDAASSGGSLPEELARQTYKRIADILCPVYQNVERILRGYVSAASGRDTYFILMSDHGFSFFFRDGRVRYNHIGQERAPDGILIVRGPGVKAGKLLGASVYDIAPTVLYLLDLPLDRTMDGEPLRRIFALKRQTRYAAYRKGKAAAASALGEAEERKLEELKALGYIN